MANFKKIFFAVVAVMGVSFAAHSGEIFTAKNIYVDVTERNSEIARRHALSEGQAVAFRKILERVVSQKDVPFLPEFSPEEVSYLLKEVSVVKESTSPVRYKATLNISFDEEKTKKILTEMGMSFVLSPSKPYLILPIYNIAGKATILENNPWQNIWRYSAPDTALVPLQNIRYDALDKQNLPSTNLTQEQLKQLASDYNTEGVYTAEVEKTINEEFKLYVKKYINGALMGQYERAFTIENGNEKQALRKIANYVTSRSEGTWREKMAVNVSEPQLMVVVVPLRDIDHLNNVIKRINKIPLIARSELKAVKQDRAQINVWHSTDNKKLENAFRGQKMRLVKVDENVYGVQDYIPAPKKKIEPQALSQTQ